LGHKRENRCPDDPRHDKKERRRIMGSDRDRNDGKSQAVYNFEQLRVPFPDECDAAITALREAHEKTKQANCEHCGLIVKNHTTGKYYFTPVRAGTLDECTPTGEFDRTASVATATYHTHRYKGTHPEIYDYNGGYGKKDIRTSNWSRLNDYLGTPLGHVLMYDPKTKKTTYMGVRNKDMLCNSLGAPKAK
jgi:hypothetical protein